MFRSITRLVAHSGVQFIDINIARGSVDSVTRHFIQRRVELEDNAVWALVAVQAQSASIDHETGGEHLQVDGRSAVRSALNRWIPIPLLRFVDRDADGRPRFDAGPYNWARLFLTAEAPGGGDAPTPRGGKSRTGPIGALRGVIALDTAIDMQSRLDVAAYLAPTMDDVRFGSTFALTDDAESLAPFLAEDWLQAWLDSVFPPSEPQVGETRSQASGLGPVANYLTLLTVLKRSGVLPSLQFFEPRPDVVPPIAVDLVVDLGHSRSCALLVESGREQGRPKIESSRLLTLRDLGEPTARHGGAFDSRLEFSRPAFGNDALSRRSGRVNAFNWPSLARLGPEAMRLSRASRAGDGATGVASPKSHLADLDLREDTWRFAADPQGAVRRTPMIAGRMLAHVSDNAGLLTGPDGAVRPIALRPKFSRSSMTGFALVEIILQALSAINAPVLSDQRGDRLGQRVGHATASAGLGGDTANPAAGDLGRAAARVEGVRRLRQLIVCVPLTMPLAERELMRERAEAAIDMLWRAMDWDQLDPEFAPLRPAVRLGLDETLAAQLVFLYDEIAQRCAGDARAFLEVMGKSRPEFGVQPCIRLGALDIGGGHANMTIVTYSAVGDDPISPTLLGVQRSDIAGEAALDHIVGAVLLPAVARALARAGMDGVDAFLARMLAVDAGIGGAEGPGARLREHWLRPAALTLVRLTAGLVTNGAPAALDMTLGQLAGVAGRPNQNVVETFAAAAKAAGASRFDLAKTPVSVRLSEIGLATKAAFAPMIANLARALVASDCDVVLLTGWMARLPAVKALLLENMPWRPDRIIALYDRPWQDWYPMSAAGREATGGKDIGLIGALLALAGGENLGFGTGGGFAFAGGPFQGQAPADAADPHVAGARR